MMISLVLMVTMLTSAPLLVRVDRNQIDTKGLEVLSMQSDYVIGRIEPYNIINLDTAEFKVLGEYKSDCIYFWVNMLPGASLEAIKSVANVLFIDGDNVLIETNEQRIKFLNTRYLRCRKLPVQPIVIKKRIKKERTKIFQTNPLVQEMVDAVDSLSLLNFTQNLQDFVSRNSYNDSCIAAANYVKIHFENLGYDSVYLHSYDSSYAPNVIAVKVGENDDSTYVICAHLDATIGSPWMNEPVAPGADDNGSGSACVLEAARVMADYEFKHRLVFICFTGEEQGLVGSWAWCLEHMGDPMYGCLNADMIGYMDTSPDRLKIYSDNQSIWLMQFVDSCANSYVPEVEIYPEVDPGMVWSDHASFWDIGVSALCHIEYPLSWNPFYHTLGDTIGGGFNDLRFCWLTTKVGVAALASLAQPIGQGIFENEEVGVVTIKRYLPSIITGVIKIPKGSSAKFFDVGGRFVIECQEEEIRLSSGIYFAVLKTKKESVVEKIICIEMR